MPTSRVFSVWANGDTIVAGADTVAYVSTDAGAHWRRSAKPVAGVTSLQAVRIRNGRLYAGTFGQGVMISDDLGTTWHAFNEGLVGGVLDAQLDVSDFAVRGDSLYAATLGAGVYVRGLAGASAWSHFGEAFEPNQASNVNRITLGGARLLACAGGNGTVFFRDPGDAEWTVSSLGNGGLLPGIAAQGAAWTGTGWVVGTNVGLLRSTLGQEPWTFLNPGLGSLDWTTFATRGRQLFGAFSTANECVIEHSGDDGASWQVLEALPQVFTFEIAMSGSELYAARLDGLWRRSTVTVSVPDGRAPRNLGFALLGAQPVGEQARFRFELAEPGVAMLELFDVAGRRAAGGNRQAWPAGAHEVALDVRSLAPGIYAARLVAGGREQCVRIVHVR